MSVGGVHARKSLADSWAAQPKSEQADAEAPQQADEAHTLRYHLFQTGPKIEEKVIGSKPFIGREENRSCLHETLQTVFMWLPQNIDDTHMTLCKGSRSATSTEGLPGPKGQDKKPKTKVLTQNG
eukprot:4728894-Amphidinium_carterae.1